MFFLSRISTCCEEEPKKYLLWYWIFCLCSCCFSFFWCCYTTQRSFCPAELGVLARIRLWKQKKTSLNVFAWTVKCIFAEENDSSSICKKKYVFSLNIEIYFLVLKYFYLDFKMFFVFKIFHCKYLKLKCICLEFWVLALLRWWRQKSRPMVSSSTASQPSTTTLLESFGKFWTARKLPCTEHFLQGTSCPVSMVSVSTARHNNR